MFTCVINGKEYSFETEAERDQAVADAQLLPKKYTVESIQGENIAQDLKKEKGSANGANAESELTAPENTEFPSVNILPELQDTSPGGEIVNQSVWEKAFTGNGETGVRTIEKLFGTSSEYTVENKNTPGRTDFNTVVTHINPETKKETTFKIETTEERGGNILEPKVKSKEFAEFVSNTMSASTAADLKVKADDFYTSPVMQELKVTNEEAEEALGTQESVFAPKTESIQIGTQGMRQTQDLTVYPYEQEIKEKADSLLKTNAMMSYEGVEKQAKADIYEKLIVEKRLDLISQKSESFVENNPDLRDEFAAFTNIKDSKLVTDFKNNTLLAKSIELDLNKISSYSDQLDEFKKNPSKPVIIDGVEWGGDSNIIGTWQSIPITQMNYDQLSSMQTNYSAKYKTFRETIDNNSLIADKMPDAFAMSKANSLNYSIAEKSMNAFSWGVADIVTGAGYVVAASVAAAGAITASGAVSIAMGDDAPSVSELYDSAMNKVDKVSNKYSEAKDESKRSFMRDVSVDDGFSSAKNFGKFFMQEASTQAPIIVAMMGTGGYGALTVGLYTGGQAGMEMAFEDAALGKDTKRINQFLTMAGIGLANALPTQLTTIPILAKAKKSFFQSGKFGVDGASEFALGVKSFVKLQYKDVVQDVLLENIGEITTNFAENAIYGNDPYENIKHVAVSSTGFSFAFSAVPFFKGIAARAVASKSEIQSLSKYSDAILAAEKSLNNHEAATQGLTGDLLRNAEVAKITLQENLNSARKTADKAAIEILEKPLNGITARGAEGFAQLQTEAAKLKREIAILSNTKGVDQSIIDNKLLDFATVKEAQELYIGSGFRNEFALMKRTDPDAYNLNISKARTKLEQENPGKIYSTNDNAVVIEATRAYNLDASRKRKNQNKKINPDLEVFETKEDAIENIMSRQDLSPETQAKIIIAIGRGSAGLSVTNEEGIRIPIAVLEIEAENNKQFVQEHEIGHGTVGLIFKEGKGAQLYELGYQIREWLKVNNASLSARMEQAMQGYENDPNYKEAAVSEEAFMEFLEMVKEKRIDLTSSNNLPLNGMMAQMVQDAVGKDVYDYDFRGVDDFAAFAINLAKGISDGTIDIAKAKETIEKIDISKVNKRISDKKSGNVKESKATKSQLNEDVKNTTSNIINEIKTLDAESQALADKFKKPFARGAKATRLEKEVISNIKPTVDRLTTTLTKRLYDPIADDAKRNVSRQEFQDSLKDDLNTMTINEYKSETNGKKNDLEKFISNRGFLRAQNLAKRLGIKSVEEGIDSDVTSIKDLAADEAVETVAKDIKQIKASSILNPEQTTKAKDLVNEWAENTDLSKQSFKSVPNLIADIIAEVFNVPVKKIINPKANLNKVDSKEAQMTMVKIGNKLKNLLPEGAVLGAANEKLIGTSTGVPKAMLDAFYTKNERLGKKQGLFPYTLNKDITTEDILAAMGILDGKQSLSYNPRSKEAQVLKGMMNLLGKLVTNEFVRTETDANANIKQNIAAGKNNLMESKRIDLSKIESLTLGVSFEFSAWYNSQNKPPSSVRQLQKLSIIAGKILGDQGRKLFNAELAANFEKLDADASLESIRDSLGTAWGKAYNWLVREQGFNKAIEKLNDKSTKEDVRQFLQGFSRAWRNDKYQDISTNEQLIEAIENQGVDFEGLGFKFQKKGKKGFVYEIKANGAIEFVNDPTTLLEIKNKSFDYIEVYGKNSVKEVQTLQKVVLDIINAAETVDDKIAAIEAMSIGQMGTLRRISYLRNVYKSSGPLVLEHVTSMAIIKEKLKDYARGEVDNIQEFFDGLYLDVIPKEVDDLLAKVGLENRYTPKIMRMLKGYEKASFDVQEAIENIKESKRIENAIKEANLAKVKESKGLDGQFNKYLEGSTGIESFKKYKSDKAKLKGRFKGKFDVFIPPSAEDFLGLLYQTLNKGKLGNAQIKFYEDNLLKPYAKANSALRTARVRSIREFDAIKKKLKIVPKDLKRSFKFEDENGNMKDSLFTKEQAIRVYIWNSQGIEMPNLSQVDLAVMVNHVNAEPELKAFADELLKLNRGMNSKAPSKNWMDGNIGIDLQANLNSVGRKKLLEVWQQNVDAIFSEENLNKLEAAYGPEYVKALESSLRRMKTGRSAPPVTDNEAGNNLITWLNSAVGNIMFFNNRSALLQMLSATNFLNFEDNNIIAAGKAFMNPKQYWKDFTMLMNSDYLLDRRDGTRININEADIALIAKQSGIQGVIAKILELGFLPTKFADSLAIATGGATFYRTKVNALVKSGMSKAKAEAQAMQEFTSVAETSQQSSDQSKISMEQAGSVGKIILAFNNTSSQYSRIIKRSVQDLYNRRGSDKANLAKIIYYGGMQNLVFNFLQQAMFAAMWGGEDDEEVLDGKKAKVVNSMADGLLRGMGVKAAIFVAIKNTAIKLYERSKKERNQDYRYYAVMGMLAVSPPLSSKASKLSRAASAYQYGKDEMKYGELSLDSPELTIGANLISFATSLPTDRLLTKAINVSDALDSSNEPWERLFMTMGWPKWTLSTKEESDLERAEDKAKIKTAKEKEEFDAMTPLEQKTKALEDLKKFQQVDSLKAYGLTDKEIRLLTKEEDRINKILSLEGQDKKGLAPADAVEEELYDLKKQQQVDSLTKYGLTKKQIRLLKYEEDRVNAIIKLQNKKRKDSLK